MHAKKLNTRTRRGKLVVSVIPEQAYYQMPFAWTDLTGPVRHFLAGAKFFGREVNQHSHQAR
jgi:hypothetical protein